MLCSESACASCAEVPRAALASRGVAQPGRAPGSGPGGRRFKSSLPDQYYLSRLRQIGEIGERPLCAQEFRCAQNCAHSTDLGPREQHLRSGEHTELTLPRNCARRFAPASKHRNPTLLASSETCGASCKERTGAPGSASMPSCAACLGLISRSARCGWGAGHTQPSAGFPVASHRPCRIFPRTLAQWKHPASSSRFAVGHENRSVPSVGPSH